MSVSLHELVPALEQMGQPRIAVVGDYMLDRYVWGDAMRVSPEAPVPVVHAAREEDRLGGAGNVVANLIALGASVQTFGLVGQDAGGQDLRAMMEAQGAHCQGLLVQAERPTIQKIRVMARNQQMLRVDREESQAVSAEVQEALYRAVANASWDALVLSDYGKGCLGAELTSRLLQLAEERGVPSLVDPKHRDFSRYRGASLITPNRAEAEQAAGASLHDFSALAAEGERLRDGAGIRQLLITLGADGMYLLDADPEQSFHIPTAARQVFDVTGAGDTVIAMLAMAFAEGLEAELAVNLANAAAGVAVAKVGTTAVGREELIHALHAMSTVGKVMTGKDDPRLAATLALLRAEGRRVVFTNGCFDLLHAGHVRYLGAARGLGDVLLVGLNSDESVRRLKGEERPFNHLLDRAEVLAALECVDMVVPFESDTPQDLIEAVSPEVLVKGADWRGKGVAGADFVESSGGEVKFIDLLPGRSTTGLAAKIRQE